MDLTPYITSLREDLSATASAGDEQTRRTAAVLSAALEPAVRLALMNALADLAAEVTAHLPEHVVEVRLDGRDVRVVVTGTTTSERSAPQPP
ncbi:toxin-antitoxin system HicB family antitoxin, partial [Amycolatopsis sp. K13G38]|nr:toxin-antitoxin system HicB family antitoxin [Amycolatopsis acididurans]